MTQENYDDIINYDWNYDSLPNRMIVSNLVRNFVSEKSHKSIMLR